MIIPHIKAPKTAGKNTKLLPSNTPFVRIASRYVAKIDVDELGMLPELPPG